MNGPHKQAPGGLRGRIAEFFRAIARRLRSLIAFPFQVLHWEVHRLRAEVSDFGAATTESISHLGVRLRSIEEALDGLLEGRGGPSSPELAFALRSLAAVDPPARVLLAGTREAAIGPSLAGLGYEVTIVPGPPSEPVDSRGYDAILCGSLDEIASAMLDPQGGGSTRAAALERLAKLLSGDGLLVFAVPVEAGANGEGGPPADLPAGWRVTDQAVVEDRAIAMVAAHPPQPG